MAAGFPRKIDPSSFPAIRENTIDREHEVSQKGGNVWQLFKEDVSQQEVFLDVFRKSYSVTMSCKTAGVTGTVYSRWRDTSIQFVLAFNEIVDMWNDSILASAAQRARGYLQLDEETESGYKEDAEGTPIYYNANDKMALTFMRAAYPGHFDERTIIDVTPPHKEIAENASIEDATSQYLLLTGIKRG